MNGFVTCALAALFGAALAGDAPALQEPATAGPVAPAGRALTSTAADPAAPGHPAVDATAAFERLKTLVGTWAARTPKGHRATLSLELVSGGSVLVERYSDEGMKAGSDMLTAYHLDGDRLVLTHYCVAGNQPTMRATAFDAGAGEIRFDFAGATNLPDPNAGHMRRARYVLEGADTFVTEWEFFEGGEPAFIEELRFERTDS